MPEKLWINTTDIANSFRNKAAYLTLKDAADERGNPKNFEPTLRMVISSNKIDALADAFSGSDWKKNLTLAENYLNAQQTLVEIEMLLQKENQRVISIAPNHREIDYKNGDNVETTKIMSGFTVTTPDGKSIEYRDSYTKAEIKSLGEKEAEWRSALAKKYIEASGVPDPFADIAKSIGPIIDRNGTELNTARALSIFVEAGALDEALGRKISLDAIKGLLNDMKESKKDDARPELPGSLRAAVSVEASDLFTFSPNAPSISGAPRGRA